MAEWPASSTIYIRVVQWQGAGLQNRKDLKRSNAGSNPVTYAKILLIPSTMAVHRILIPTVPVQFGWDHPVLMSSDVKAACGSLKANDIIRFDAGQPTTITRLLTRSLMATARFFSRVSRLKRDLCGGILIAQESLYQSELCECKSRPSLHFQHQAIIPQSLIAFRHGV